MSTVLEHAREFTAHTPLMLAGQVVVVMAAGGPGGGLGHVGICSDVTHHMGSEQYVVLFENGHLVRLTRREAEGTLRVTHWSVSTLLRVLEDNGVSREDVLRLAPTGTDGAR